MGTWHYDAKTLVKVLKTPIKVKDATNKLGEGLGDDWLFDFILDLEKDKGKKYIVNKDIIKFLKLGPKFKYKGELIGDKVWLSKEEVDEINAMLKQVEGV